MKVFMNLLLCYKTIASQVVIEQEFQDSAHESLVICNPIRKDSIIQVYQEDEEIRETSIVEDGKIEENDKDKVDQINTQGEIEEVEEKIGEINAKQSISCKETKSKIISFVCEKFKTFRDCISSLFKKRSDSSKPDVVVDIEQPVRTCETTESLESQE